MEYNFDIEFVKGSKNVVADYLPRMPVEVEETIAEVVSRKERFVDGELGIVAREWMVAREDDDVMKEVEEKVCVDGKTGTD